MLFMVVCVLLPASLANRAQRRSKNQPLEAPRLHLRRHADVSHNVLSDVSEVRAPINPHALLDVAREQQRDIPTLALVAGLNFTAENISGAQQLGGKDHLGVSNEQQPSRYQHYSKPVRPVFGGFPHFRTVGDQLLDTELLAAAPPGEPLPVLMAIGGGTGASLGTGTKMGDRDLMWRMHYQDKAVMLLVLVVYLVALVFSASVTYRQACNNIPVTYYADPRYHSLVAEGHDIDAFLDCFNQAPKNIALQVAGFVQVPEEIHGSIQWRGQSFQTAFTFSLDLSPWVVRQTQTTLSPEEQTRTLHEGVLPEERSTLHNYLTSDGNDLAFVEITKKVSWQDYEELATNIKHQIRRSGFTGVISVDRIESDEVQVYKNKPWANFMHARSTRVLCALSVFGWLMYLPYMWFRCRKVSIRSHYAVDVPIGDYWSLIADKLTADGFQENGRISERNNA
jgi:hypothetical protein